MQVEQLGKLERRLSISLLLADIEKEVDVRLKRISRTVKMSGFRPGKVPMKLVAQQYGFQVQNDVLNEQVGTAFNKAVAENQLRVAGSPNIAPKSGDGVEEGMVAFDATFEVYPEVAIGELKDLEVEEAVTVVGDAEVDKTIEILRGQRVHYHTKGEHSEHGDGGEAVAADKDRVVLDFEGTIDGVPFDGGTAKDFDFVLGQGRMLPEFEAATLGMKVGEKKTFSLTFPADYHGKDVAGKTAEFTITVTAIEWAHTPDVDEDFARSLGIEDGNIEAMRADIRANLEREVKKRIQARTKDSVMNALLTVSTLDVPKALVDADIQRLIQMTRDDMRQRGMKVDEMPFPGDLFQSQAERRVRLGLVLAELVKLNNLQATPDQVKQQIEDFAESYENPPEVVRWYYADRGRLGEVEALVLEQNVVNYVANQAKTRQVEVAFDDLMGSNAA